MSKVEVLCPNGHRVNVKITPNTRLLQVVEEACAKKGFSPASDYGLKHGRTTLDVSLTVRYAGLPNLAKLELVKTGKSRAEADVLIALQLASGERLQREFPPSTPLWRVLEHWDSQSDRTEKLARVTEEGLHPVCVYMREEVVGEAALRHTTLRKIGLTGGRAIIRILHRAVDESTLGVLQTQIEKERAMEQKLSSKPAASQHQPSQESKAEASQAPAKTCNTAQPCDSTTPSTDSMDTDHRLAAMESDANKNMNSEQSNLHRNKPVNEAVPMEVSTETDSTSSGTKQGSDEDSSKQIQLKRDTERADQLQSNSSGAHGGVALAPGVIMFRPGDVQLTPEEQRLARQLAERFAIFPEEEERRAETERLRAEQVALVHQMRQERRMRELQQAQPRAEFKFPEATKGKALYQNEYGEASRKEFTPCERETVTYHIEAVPAALQGSLHEEVSADFFDVTEEDMRKLWSDSQRKLREIQEQPLMTQGMREAARDAHMTKYARAVIRVQFADKHVLQGLFRPRETVHALYQYVKRHLQDQTTDFYLYTSPPKSLLKDKTNTLIQASLTPMSVVYFGADEKKDRYLKEDLLENLSTMVEANKVLVTHMQPKEQPQSAPEAAGASGRSGGGLTSHTSSGASANNSKTPKWFKIGKK